MRKPTIGPWREAIETYSTHNHPSRSWETAIYRGSLLVGRSAGATEAEAAANARLMAVAPELLGYLRLAFNRQMCTCKLLRFVGETPPCPTCTLGALIAKAEGHDNEV